MSFSFCVTFSLPSPIDLESPPPCQCAGQLGVKAEPREGSLNPYRLWVASQRRIPTFSDATQARRAFEPSSTEARELHHAGGLRPRGGMGMSMMKHRLPRRSVTHPIMPFPTSTESKMSSSVELTNSHCDLSPNVKTIRGDGEDAASNSADEEFPP